MTIGEIIKQYRDEHGLSQRQFAERCGDITNGYISMIEQGKNPSTGKPIVPSIEKVASLARAMGMTLHQLVASADDTLVTTGQELHNIGQNMTAPSRSQEWDELSKIGYALSEVMRGMSESGMNDVLKFARFVREQEEKDSAAHDD